MTVSPYQTLAMRLMGASFAGHTYGPRYSDGVAMQAVALQRGDGPSRPEVETLRETLIQGNHWVLVDEDQDIGPEEYALIGGVAGRSLEDDLRISQFTVGDDDQNIYAFAGATIDFIRRFGADYAAKPVWLTENYRSFAYIIAAANAVIAPAAQRMKAGHDITVNRARAKAMPGGDWAALDLVAQGRVTLLEARGDAAQALAELDELLRLSQLAPDWSWRRCAVVARDWRRLQPVKAYAEAQGIPIDMANETMPSLSRLREMQGCWLHSENAWAPSLFPLFLSPARETFQSYHRSGTGPNSAPVIGGRLGRAQQSAKKADRVHGCIGGVDKGMPPSAGIGCPACPKISALGRSTAARWAAKQMRSLCQNVRSASGTRPTSLPRCASAPFSPACLMRCINTPIGQPIDWRCQFNRGVGHDPDGRKRCRNLARCQPAIGTVQQWRKARLSRLDAPSVLPPDQSCRRLGV